MTTLFPDLHVVVNAVHCVEKLVCVINAKHLYKVEIQTHTFGEDGKRDFDQTGKLLNFRGMC